MPLPLFAPLAISAGTSLLGSLFGKKQDKKMMEGMRTNLAQRFVTGPGGMEGWAGDNGAGYSLGDLAPLAGSQAFTARTASDMAGQSLYGVPGGVAAADEALYGQDLDLGAFMRGQAGGSMLASRSMMDIFGGGFDPNQIAATQLQRLRASAAPQEEADRRNFISDLYTTGRGAVTGAAGNEASLGGGRLAAAFAQGQGRADLERQIAAQETGIQSAVASENLLRSAFGRFMDSSQFAAQNNEAMFGRQRGALESNFARSIQMAGLPAQIAAGFQNLAGAASGNVANLYGLGMDQANLALDTAAAGANARIGSATAQANYMRDRSATPVLDSVSNIFGGMVTPQMGQQATDWLGGLFRGRGGKTAPILDSSGSPIPGTY